MSIRGLLIVVLSLCLGMALPALAQDDKTEVFTTTYDPATSAHFRFAHFVSDADSVEVYVDGELSDAKGLAYPDVSDWITVPAGAHTLAIVPAGAAEDAALLEPLAVTMEPTGFYTVVVLGNAADGTLQAQVLEADTSSLTPGTTRVTFLQGIDKGDNVGFYRDDVPYTTGFDLGEVYTENMDSGIHMFQVVTGGDAPVVLAEQADVELRENRSYIIASVGQAGSSGVTEPQFVIIETSFADYRMGAGALAQPGTIVQAVQAEDLTGDLSDALVAANLIETLEGEGPFTLFAPAELSLDDLESKDPATLEAILSAHVVEGEYLSQDLANGVSLTSLAGTPITVDVANNGFNVNGVSILTVNIPASNGVVHLIGGLLTDEVAANG